MTDSQRQQRADLVRVLRAHGMTWVEVAEAVRRRFRVNARVTFRLAHGWSQHQVAERWNQSWPDDPKTHKNISYWELWPASTGHAPSLEVLSRLAEIYACSVSDLAVDLANHRHLDAAGEAGPQAFVGAGDAGRVFLPEQMITTAWDLLGGPPRSNKLVRPRWPFPRAMSPGL